MKRSLFAIVFSLLLANVASALTLELADEPAAFDRAQLIPLDEALPVSARPPAPDYSRPSEDTEPVTYFILYESATGEEDALSAYISNDTEKLFSNGVPFFYPFTTVNGQQIHIPLFLPKEQLNSFPPLLPSRATYRIIGNR